MEKVIFNNKETIFACIISENNLKAKIHIFMAGHNKKKLLFGKTHNGKDAAKTR